MEDLKKELENCQTLLRELKKRIFISWALILLWVAVAVFLFLF